MTFTSKHRAMGILSTMGPWSTMGPIKSSQLSRLVKRFDFFVAFHIETPWKIHHEIKGKIKRNQ
jgi:hypothetical protein